MSESKLPTDTPGLTTNGSDNGQSESQDSRYLVFHDLYDHGFVNGIMRVPREHFEQFLEGVQTRDLSRKELGITLQEIEAVKEEIRQTRQKRVELENTVSACHWELEAARELRDRTEVEIASRKAETGALQDEMRAVPIEYTWINVVLFIAFGFLFLIADFYITFDVLFNSLGLVIWGAIALAVAVSGITFVIKPTIDRIFEKPYWKGAGKLQHGLLISISILAIAVLGFLGYFREVYFQNNARVEILKKELQDEENADAPDVKKIASISNALRSIRYNQSSNGALYVIFVLSNILFAIAAAICLSIAFPAADRLLNKAKMNKSVQQALNDLKSLENEIFQLIDRARQILTNRDKAKNELAYLPELAQLEDRLDQLSDLSRSLLQRAAMYDLKADQGLYNEAYARGLECELSDKIVFSPPQLGSLRYRPKTRKETNRPSRPSSPESTDAIQDEPDISDGYLYQQIRQMIQYNNQRKKQTLHADDE